MPREDEEHARWGQGLTIQTVNTALPVVHAILFCGAPSTPALNELGARRRSGPMSYALSVDFARPEQLPVSILPHHDSDLRLKVARSVIEKYCEYAQIAHLDGYVYS